MLLSVKTTVWACWLSKPTGWGRVCWSRGWLGDGEQEWSKGGCRGEGGGVPVRHTHRVKTTVARRQLNQILHVCTEETWKVCCPVKVQRPAWWTEPRGRKPGTRSLRWLWLQRQNKGREKKERRTLISCWIKRQTTGVCVVYLTDRGRI